MLLPCEKRSKGTEGRFGSVYSSSGSGIDGKVPASSLEVAAEVGQRTELHQGTRTRLDGSLLTHHTQNPGHSSAGPLEAYWDSLPVSDFVCSSPFPWIRYNIQDRLFNALPLERQLS